jgi:SAM-dependent methyltransferase
MVDSEEFGLGRAGEMPALVSARLGALLDAHLDPAQPVRVLEAGGGSFSNIRIKRQKHVTTIDISPEQIEKNTISDVKILGDLETYDYGDRRFDAVICYNVIEHLDRAEVALRKLCAATDEGGVVLIAAPDRRSLKGLITKLSPHWFHVLVYRVVFGLENAGKPGHVPFKTFLRPIVTPEALCAAFEAEGFEVRFVARYVGRQVEMLRKRFAPGYHAYAMLSRAVEAITGGRTGSQHTDFFVIAQKRARAGAGAQAAA